MGTPGTPLNLGDFAGLSSGDEPVRSIVSTGRLLFLDLDIVA